MENTKIIENDELENDELEDEDIEIETLKDLLDDLVNQLENASCRLADIKTSNGLEDEVDDDLREMTSTLRDKSAEMEKHLMRARQRTLQSSA